LQGNNASGEQQAVLKHIALALSLLTARIGSWFWRLQDPQQFNLAELWSG
jgi:hypothetical protein